MTAGSSVEPEDQEHASQTVGLDTGKSGDDHAAQWDHAVMTDQLDEPDDEGLAEPERLDLSRFHDAFAPLIEEQNRRFRDSLAPLIEHHSTVFGDIGKKLAEAAAIKVKIPNLGLDVPSPAMTALSDAVQRLADLSDFNATMREMVDSINERFQEQWQGLFESLGNIAARIFPENWDGVATPTIDDLETILIDEGIPLMWVPGPKVVEALIKADDASALGGCLSFVVMP
jgi:hypothetical protein